MTEFKAVSGQIEGLWNVAMKEAELAGRRSGEASATEAALQAVKVMVTERTEGRSQWRDGDLVQELRRRLSAEPDGELLGLEDIRTEEEARAALGLGAARFARVPLDVYADLLRELEGYRAGAIVAGADNRPGFRVGDVAAPLDTIAQAQAEEGAADAAREADLAAEVAAVDAGRVFQRDAAPGRSATGEALRQADLEARERSTL